MAKEIRKMIDILTSYNQMPINENVMQNSYKSIDFTIVPEGMFTAAYFGTNGSALRFRMKKFNDVNDGYPVYEIHIDIAPIEQGKGMAENMIKAFLYKEGGVAYFAYGRIQNDAVYKVLDKIKKDDNWLVQEEGNGITVEEK